MPLYTSIGKYDLDVSINDVNRSGTGAWSTSSAIQFRDDMNLYGIHFNLPNGTAANVSLWKYWSTDTSINHKGLIYETSCTSLYLPLSLPLGTNEAFVVECTATEEKRMYLEVGRWDIGGGNVNIAPFVNGTFISGIAPGGADNPISTSQVNGPTEVWNTNNVTAGTYRSILDIKAAGYNYFNVDYELDDLTLEAYLSNNTNASTAGDTGWKLISAFGTQTATGMYERDTPCGADRMMLKYIATDSSNDIEVRVTRFA